MRIPLALACLAVAACGARSLGDPDAGADATPIAEAAPPEVAKETSPESSAASAHDAAVTEAGPSVTTHDAGGEAPSAVAHRRVSGSVALSTIDPSIPAHVTAAPCDHPGWVVSTQTQVWNDRLGVTAWDCTSGSFFYGASAYDTVPLPPGDYVLHFVPPDYYDCVGAYIYGTLLAQSFSTFGHECTASMTVAAAGPPDDIFIWFYTKAQNWQPCAEDANCQSGICGCNLAPRPTVCLPNEQYPRACSD